MTDQRGPEPHPSTTTDPGAAAGGGRSRRRAAVLRTASVASVAVAFAATLAVSSDRGWSLSVGPSASDAAAGGPLTGERASAELRRLAARVAGLPDDTGGGRYAYLRTESWYDRDSADGGAPASGAAPVHERRSEWFADDHSGRWTVDRVAPGGATEHETGDEPALPVAGADDAGDHRFQPLPTDDAVLARTIREEVAGGALPWLAVGDSATDEDVAEYLATHEDPRAYLSVFVLAERFVGGDDRQPRTPPERAAALRYLATVPGVTVTHDVTDAAGRSGTAVSVRAPAGFPEDGGHASVMLLVDPTAGQVLATELSAGTAEAAARPSDGVRYLTPGDVVTVVHVARFTDRPG
jgi:hypothetical protein